MVCGLEAEAETETETETGAAIGWLSRHDGAVVLLYEAVCLR